MSTLRTRTDIIEALRKHETLVLSFLGAATGAIVGGLISALLRATGGE